MSKILLIEDDMALANLYKTELQLREYQVVHVSDGSKALEAIKSEKPDLILLDIMLPGKNGLQILQDMREDESLSDMKVVMLTNFGNEENVSTALEQGALDYIMKYKIVPAELADKISSYLGENSESVVSVTNN